MTHLGGPRVIADWRQERAHRRCRALVSESAKETEQDTPGGCFICGVEKSGGWVTSLDASNRESRPPAATPAVLRCCRSEETLMRTQMVRTLAVGTAQGPDQGGESYDPRVLSFPWVQHEWQSHHWKSMCQHQSSGLIFCDPKKSILWTRQSPKVPRTSDHLRSRR